MKILPYIFLMIFCGYLSAQDAQFSQYYAAPLHLSPSFAGATGGGRLVGNHRIQWPLMSVPYQTFSVSADYNLINYNSGVGFLMLGELAGTPDLYRTKTAVQYTYNVGINKNWNIRPALELSYNFMGFMNSKEFIFGDQMWKAYFEGLSSTDIETDDPQAFNSTDDDYFDLIKYPDAGTSVLAFSHKYWVGLTVSHLLRPNISVYNSEDKIPIKYLLYGGGKIDLNGRLGRKNEESIFYSFLYRAQGKADQFDVGAYWYKLPLVVGFWYRGLPGFKRAPDGAINQDAATFIVGYRSQDFGVAYSYDATISRLIINTGGTHEISLVYLFHQDRRPEKRAKRIIVPCPRF